MYGLSLEWEHCPDGIELVDYAELSPPPAEWLPLLWEPDKVFRCKTDRRFPILLSVNLEDPVVLHFINARDDNARARFLARFGFLSNLHLDVDFRMPPTWTPDRSWPVGTRDDFVRAQGELRQLLALAGSDQEQEAEKSINLRLDSIRFDPVFEARRMSFKLRDLFSLLVREIIMVAENNARFTTCERCEAGILTGPGTGRRSHATYCSDRCRVAAMRARNAASSKR
jgi:hypothetical protein